MIRSRPAIVVLSGSLRAQSHNSRLAALVAKALALRDTEVRPISLSDYVLPIFDADLEAERGVPEAARRLHDLIVASQGVFIASPEYNQSVTPLLKNTIDWLSRIRTDGPGSLWKDRVYAIGAASPGHFAGIRSLMHLRQILENALSAQVIAEQVALPYAASAFDEAGNLVNDKVAQQIDRLADRLIEEAARYA